MLKFGGLKSDAIVRSHALMPKSHALMPKSHAVMPKYYALMPKPHAVMPKYYALMPKPHALMSKSHALMPKSHAVMPKSNAVMPKSNAVMPNSHAAMPKVPSAEAQIPGADAQTEFCRPSVPLLLQCTTAIINGYDGVPGIANTHAERLMLPRQSGLPTDAARACGARQTAELLNELTYSATFRCECVRSSESRLRTVHTAGRDALYLRTVRRIFFTSSSHFFQKSIMMRYQRYASVD
jgi:hypothetical protein